MTVDDCSLRLCFSLSVLLGIRSQEQGVVAAMLLHERRRE